MIAPAGSNHPLHLLELQIPPGLIGFYQQDAVKKKGFWGEVGFFFYIVRNLVLEMCQLETSAFPVKIFPHGDWTAVRKT